MYLITGNSHDEIYHFQMNAFLVFSIFTVLVQPSPWSNSRTLPSPQQDTPHFLISLSQSSVVTVSLSASVDLPVLFVCL